MNPSLVVKAIAWWLIAMIVAALMLALRPPMPPDVDYVVLFTIGLATWLVPGLVGAFQATARRALQAAVGGVGAVLAFWGYAAISSALALGTVEIPMANDPAMLNFGRYVAIPILIPAFIGWMRDHRLLQR
jgi:hypothetical protein